MSLATTEPHLETPVTACLLLYGDYPALAERLLCSLLQHTPPGALCLRVGLNAVSAATFRILDRLLPYFAVEMVIDSPVNLYKGPMMRRLFHSRPISTAWTLWFDDDTYVFRDDWLAMLAYASRLAPGTDMWGKKLFVRGEEDHRRFIQSASWYRGLKPMADDEPEKCRIVFISGGFWAIRTGLISHLQWPDPRLLHFGDDYMLGEALRQLGNTIGQAYSGVAIGRHSRRAPAGTPASEALC